MQVSPSWWARLISSALVTAVGRRGEGFFLPPSLPQPAFRAAPCSRCLPCGDVTQAGGEFGSRRLPWQDESWPHLSECFGSPRCVGGGSWSCSVALKPLCCSAFQHAGPAQVCFRGSGWGWVLASLECAASGCAAVTVSNLCSQRVCFLGRRQINHRVYLCASVWICLCPDGRGLGGTLLVTLLGGPLGQNPRAADLMRPCLRMLLRIKLSLMSWAACKRGWGGGREGPCILCQFWLGGSSC